MCSMAPSVSSTEFRGQGSKPSPLACWECRKKHLKCDASTPVCSRCSSRGLDCTYVPSRRGYRGSPPRKHNIISGRRSEPPYSPPGQSTTVPASLTSFDPSDVQISETFCDRPEPIVQTHRSLDGASEQLSRHRTKDTTPATQDEEYLTNLFYSHFHPTHPFLVPHSRYKTQGYPMHLRLVVQLVGSQYAPTKSSDGLLDAVDATLATISDPSVSLVQSLLLFAIVLHARLEMAKAIVILARASDTAISLGLNRVEFAFVNGMQDPLLEESLRRTWWELYVVDGYFAALHRQTTFKCDSVESTVSLPCDESLYIDGMLRPPPVTLHQFDQRFFSSEDKDFASACYRIAAIRILARAIATMRCGDDAPDDVQAVDNALAAWKFHLPTHKATVFNSVGDVDQMIMQAHSFISYIRILVHFPRSELLAKLPSVADIACLGRMNHASPTSTQHAIKAISASKDLSDLAALPINRHSPLFICCLVFGCIVQLSACSAHSHDCLVQHRERVAIMTGVLKHMGRVWPLSQDVLYHLNRIASTVFNPRNAVDSDSSQTPSDSAIDINSMSDTFSWLDQIFAGESNISEGFTSWNWGV
jgi:hypothetical protein